MKNVIVRTAHLKELMGEKTWKVTPRSVHPDPPGPPDGIDRRDPSSVGAALRGDDAPASADYNAAAPTPIPLRTKRAAKGA